MKYNYHEIKKKVTTFYKLKEQFFFTRKEISKIKNNTYTQIKNMLIEIKTYVAEFQKMKKQRVWTKSVTKERIQ